MLVVTASAVDSHVAALLPHFRRVDVLLLTPADLSQPGWDLWTDRPGKGHLVASGESIAIEDVEGVLSLLPVVFPQELVAIEEQARTYAAQEMTAFLRYFLTALPCPVLNQATAGSLCGPLWRPERWLHVAAACGIATDVWQRGVEEADEEAAMQRMATVTLIGDDVIDDAHREFRSTMKMLAQAAKVGMLSARFRLSPRGALFCGADACPRLSESRAADLVEEFFIRQWVLT